MNEVLVSGVPLRFRGEILEEAVVNVKDTLAVLPAPHLTQLRRIDVLPAANFGHGDDYRGGGSAVGFPRLSVLCFDFTDAETRRQNQPLNRTLLHEIGHVMEHLHDCLATLPTEHRDALMAVPIPRSAATHGVSEHYAIAYQQFFTGGASAEVRAAILASAAFAAVDDVHL